MILAAAAFAEKQGPPPPELMLAQDARFWGTLPEVGGLRDQRAGELRRMSAALNAYEAVRAFHASKDKAKWARDYPGQWEVFQHVMTLRAKRAKGAKDG